MHNIYIAINDPMDGILITHCTQNGTSEDTIKYVKNHMESLRGINIQFGVVVEFADGTTAVWNKGQQSECLK